MSYEYYVTKRAPIASWVLDDTVPFQEYTGFNVSGGKKTGTSDPGKSAALVSGAAWSSVFKSGAIGQFTCPLFKQGLEDRPFALETWLYPIVKTSGVSQQPQYTNLYPNPNMVGSTSPASGSPGTSGVVSTSIVTGGISASGTTFGRITWTTSPTVTNNNGWNLGTFTGISPNDVMSASVYVRASQANTVGLYVQFLDSGGANIGNHLISVALTANTWTQIKVENRTAPAGTVSVRLLAFQVSGTVWATNATLDVDSIVLVKGATVPVFFDGSTPGYVWNGTANSSTSSSMANVGKINLALNPNADANTTGWNTNNAPLYAPSHNTTSPISGAGSFRITRTASSPSSGVVSAHFNGVGGGGVSALPVVSGATVYYSVDARPSLLVNHSLSASYWDSAGTFLSSTTVASGIASPANVVTRLSMSHTVPSGAAYATFGVTAFLPSGNTVGGEFVDYDNLLISPFNTDITYFDGSSDGSAWSGTANNSWSYVLPSNMPQQVLSHDGQYDGLTINGNVVKFSTQYLTTGEAACSYDLGSPQKAHIVAIHDKDQNQLWVNGVRVASVEITDAQKEDQYIAAATSELFSGLTISSQEIAMNGVSFYPSLDGVQILQNYDAGNKFVEQARVHPQYDGVAFNLNNGNGSVFLDHTWDSRSEFDAGLKDNVEYSEEAIYPSQVNGTSLAGSWTTAAPLDNQGDTSIYGVALSWSGLNVDVDVSLDGTTWTQAYNNQLVDNIPNGYNPTGKDLRIRVSFAGGVTDDPAFLESMRVIGFRNNQFANSEVRSITATYPAVLRDNYEPMYYRDDNGVYLDGGTLTIGPDTSSSPVATRTLELWIKPVSGTPTISVADTKYRNGVADTTLPVGEWSLIHYVAAADITADITVSGDCIVGQATLYPSALTATDVDFIYKSYTGLPVVRFSDSTVITVSESNPATSIYNHDWSISGAG